MGHYKTKCYINSHYFAVVPVITVTDERQLQNAIVHLNMAVCV